MKWATLSIANSLLVFVMAASVWAAELQIPADQWDELSAEEQEQIEANLKKHGLLKAEDVLVPGPKKDKGVGCEWGLCRLGGGGALLGCAALSSPLALVFCGSIVETAKNWCLEGCKKLDELQSSNEAAETAEAIQERSQRLNRDP